MITCCRFVASNLVLEYTLSVSVCARAATAYGATLLGLQPSYGLVEVSFMKMDFCAVMLIAALAVLLSLGTKEGATFNTGKLLPSFSAHSSTLHLPRLHGCNCNLYPSRRAVN